ncbi:MAG: hypothetical protein A3H62_00930 [Candidatus Ryanbacteria bacterium RIFCSPLOWO2_02_FULL_44_40]|nr:MAG: hypothetical protein A3E55_00550 [Candidatus Ryanbacteria bacterium RIFCSPHIGHO2_12_FULL_44_20]OGZ51391.1 MAG: hypothetical protein A3A17_00180 [Candidatus Ryanbacteria bacterium RIFCSPLOWO2_01_FULL_44_230]OGZ53705.1 MAG: hypothetical protein A3H62_00930 [Candidatus Ryanbacteria bacterium RIFCSPLOWO2_02_FULL_44_40]
MASMMTNALGASGGALHHPLVIPIPLHRLKERRRGFNQSELLAALIAKTASLPKIEKNVFVRTRKSPPQVTAASADEREKQVRGVFIVRDDTPIRGRDILLIDDVATTGATLKEAAKTLKNGGAENIHALIFARG